MDPKVTEMIRKSMLMMILGLLLSMAGPAFADGDAAAGETAAAGCIGCHGADGTGVGENPSITGFEYEVLVTNMTAYRSKEKEEMMMNMLFASMSDEDIANLAAYYALMTAE